MRRREVDMKRERKKERDVSASTPSSVTDDGVDAETSLSFFLSLSSCLPLFSAFFSRAHYWVNKYILKNACELQRVVLYFKELNKLTTGRVANWQRAYQLTCWRQCAVWSWSNENPTMNSPHLTTLHNDGSFWGFINTESTSLVSFSFSFPFRQAFQVERLQRSRIPTPSLCSMVDWCLSMLIVHSRWRGRVS